MNASQFANDYALPWPETPLQNVGNVWLKREDHNVTGSVKSRGMVWQIAHMVEGNHREIVVSSSGNASVAAAYYCQVAGITLHAFVPPFIEPVRFERLSSYGAIIHKQEMAIQGAIDFSHKHSIPYVRQSKDSNATKGYQALWDEIQQQIKTQGENVDGVSIFFPVSSGTTVQGFWEGIVMADTPRESMPQIHVVQSQHINTIASKFDTTFRKKARSIVTGIVARQTDRKELVIDAVKATNGSGWIVTDDEVLSAINTLTEYGVTDFSKEGALAYAGFIKAQTVNFKINSHVVVVLT